MIWRYSVVLAGIDIAIAFVAEVLLGGCGCKSHEYVGV